MSMKLASTFSRLIILTAQERTGATEDESLLSAVCKAVDPPIASGFGPERQTA